MLQLQEMGEKKEEYASLWKYMEGETEHRFPYIIILIRDSGLQKSIVTCQ